MNIPPDDFTSKLIFYRPKSMNISAADIEITDMINKASNDISTLNKYHESVKVAVDVRFTGRYTSRILNLKNFGVDIARKIELLKISSLNMDDKLSSICERLVKLEIPYHK